VFKIEVNLKRLHPDAIVPTYATDGSACFDFYAVNDALISNANPKIINTGWAVEVPVKHVLLIYSRSGHAFNHSVRLANCVGVIDSDYRGEVKVMLTSDNFLNDFWVHKGDRVAQGLVVPYDHVVFNEVDELSGTDRGEGGMGHTGS